MIEAVEMLQEGGSMKAIFNNKRKVVFYSLFAIAMLSFVALLLSRDLFNVDIYPLVFIVALIGMVFTGGIVLQLRSGPPW